MKFPIQLLRAQSTAYSGERMFDEETDQSSDEGDLLALTNGNGESQKRNAKPEEHKPPMDEHESPTIERVTEEVDVYT